MRTGMEHILGIQKIFEEGTFSAGILHVLLLQKYSTAIDKSIYNKLSRNLVS